VDSDSPTDAGIAVTGGFLQAFNAQLAVDAQTQIIVSAAVTNEINDRESFSRCGVDGRVA